MVAAGGHLAAGPGLELAPHPMIGEGRERQIAELVLGQLDVDEVCTLNPEILNGALGEG